VEPAGGYAGQATVVRLRGNGFALGAVQQLNGGGHIAVDDGFRAFLGTTELQQVEWVDSGTLLATVPADIPAGIYGLSIEGPSGNGTVSDAFRVVSGVPAFLTASATGPAAVHTGTEFIVAQTISNAGGMTALRVTPGTPSINGPAATVQVSPGASDIPAGAELMFTWRIVPSGSGTLQLTLPVSGVDEVDARTLSADSKLTVQSATPAHLVATPGILGSPVAVSLPIQLSLSVLNDGGSDALGVLPDVLSGTANVSVISAPAAEDIPAGATQTFQWTVKATAPSTNTFGSGGATGTDAVDNSPVGFGPLQWNPISFVVEAGFDATLTVPPGLLPGETLTVSFFVSNPTSIGANNVLPQLALSGTAAGSLIPLSAPSSTNLGPGQSTTFVWTYTTVSPGTLQLDVSARGTDASSGGPVTASRSASALVGDAAPVAQDPFVDGTTFSYVFAYAGRIYLGPSKDGTSAVRMQPDGTLPETVRLAFLTDPGGVKNNVSPTPSAFPSLGFRGCLPDTLECGPDNEDGRGLFTSFTSGGTEWLFATGDKQTSVMRHCYFTSDVTTAPSFSYTRVNLGGGMRGATVAAALGSTLYVGLADGGGSGFPAVVPIAAPYDTSHVGGAMFPNPLQNVIGGTTLIDSMALFNGGLYAGNAGGCGRYDGSSWTSCKPSAWSLTPVTTSKKSDFVPADKAIPAMVPFNGALYAALNTTSGPQLWRCSPAAGQPCTSSNWTQVAPNEAGNLLLSQFDDSSLSTVSLLVATSQHLYVGYDSAAGIALFRSTTAAPAAQADFQRWATVGLGSGLTQIVDGQALVFGPKEFLYLAAHPASGPMRVYRVAP
jgi:hypothetical protein